MVNHRLPAAGCDLRDRSIYFRLGQVRTNEAVCCHGCHCQDPNSNIYSYQWTDFRKLSEDCQRYNGNVDKLQRLEKLKEAQRDNQRRTQEQNEINNQSDRHSGASPLHGRDGRHQTGGNAAGAGPWGSCQSGVPAPEGTCPMPNSRPLPCQCGYKGQGGCSCSCGQGGAPLVGLTWGHRKCPDARGVSGCLERSGSKILVTAGYLDKHDARRPIGQPYFTHESKKSCPPAEAPLAGPSQFKFEQWMNTVDSRKPPPGLDGKCIGSVCMMCGPRYEECCSDYSNPLNYVISKQMRH